MGKQLVFVPECHSTNSIALQLSQNQSTADGAVVITNHQTAGRGQRGNTWESAQHLNLTFSTVVKPSFLAIGDQYYLTMVTSLAVRDFLSGKTNWPIAIKWPNDILVHGKKICGILIENQLQGTRFNTAVIGIGININQTHFSGNKITSLKLITNEETPLEPALHQVLECLEVRYIQLRQQKKSSLKDDYLRYLYWRNERHQFLSGTTTFDGIIKGIDEAGRLEVDTDEGLKRFGIKEIAFVK